MLIKSATLLGLLALASAATIYQRNIPVEVRYDEPVAAESVRNLDIAAQQIPVDLKEKPAGPLLEPIVIEEKPNAVRNLDEKIQLSSEDLGQALKHLPVNQEPAPVEDSEKIQPTPEDLGETLIQLPVKQETAPVEVTEKVQPALEELSQTLKQLPVKQKPIPVEDLAVAETVQVTKIDDTPQIEEITRQPEVLKSVLQKAEDIIYSGLKNLRASFRPGESQQVPNAEQWDDLEKAVNQYLDEEKTKLQQKQSQPTTPGSGQNFFQNLASGFQTIANNFVQNLPGSQNVIENSTSQGDEQQGSGSQGPFQGFVNYFQGGVNNIANAINNLGNPGSTTSNTVLGDTGDGPTTQAPGFISNFVNNVQQFFGQLQQGAQGAVPDVTQGDTGVSNATGGPAQVIQGPGQVIQSIGSAITNFIQGGNRPPNTSGDEGTATTQSSNIIQSIGSVIQNSPLNPFRPQQQGEGADGTTSNPIQAGIQNVGNQFQQFLSGQGTTPQGNKDPEDEAPNVENSENLDDLQAQEVSPGQSNSITEHNPENDVDDIQNNQVDEQSVRYGLNTEEEHGGSLSLNNEEINLEELRDRIVQEEVEKQLVQEEIRDENQAEEVTREIERIQDEIRQDEPVQEYFKPIEQLQEEIREPALQTDALLGDPVHEEIRRTEPIQTVSEHEQIYQQEPGQDEEESVHEEIKLYIPVRDETVTERAVQPVVEQKEEILMTAE